MAQITYKSLSNAKVSGFVTKDISQGGICFYAHDFLPVNSLLKIKVKLRKIYFAFEAMVRIRWIKKDPLGDRYEVGVDFADIPKEAAHHLTEYIRLTLNTL